jgi:hypothetical protein
MGDDLAGDVASNPAVDTINSFVRRSAEDNALALRHRSRLLFSSNRLRTAIHPPIACVLAPPK